MPRPSLLAALALCLSHPGTTARAADVPRPEHPTPDAVRPHWANLNGTWEFRLDPKDEGLKQGWEKPGAGGFDRSIVVPFPWESELSGIHRPDYHGVAWYRRTFTVPADFPKNDRVWLRFGAVDWRADVWVNGEHVAEHVGGYTPFEADITEALKTSAGKPAVLVVRVFDPTDPEQPTGKQVGWYTSTSGIWQTVWLESVPTSFITGFTIRSEVPNEAGRVDREAVAVFDVEVGAEGGHSYSVTIRPDDPAAGPPVSHPVKVPSRPSGGPFGGLGTRPVDKAVLTLKVRNPKLWTPEAPHLYDATIELKDDAGKVVDSVRTYFGLRTIARGRYGDEPYERLLLNGKPIYLRAVLDQSFNPKGIYTAPSDDFLKKDMTIAKAMGLNGLRIHIKPDEPRRLYWADRLGMLILEDMPNTWRQSPAARKGWEATMREAVARDRNHPSIVGWVAFNETWGLGSPDQYKKDKDTQGWVGRMVDEIKKLDPTRLVEDNSPCNYDHIEKTDINSWHFYIDDHAQAARHVDEVVKKTEPGSAFNYCPGRAQGTSPLINSEYGGVSAGGGDRDVSWCFRDLTTLLRRQPKVQGYIYTELSDIEWEHNGFVNYDRTPKAFGYGAFVPGMTPADLNGADFVGYEGPPARVVKPGEKVEVPVFVSHFSERTDPPELRWRVAGWDDAWHETTIVPPATRAATWAAYDVRAQTPVTFNAPDRPFVGAVGLELIDPKDKTRLAANFVNIVVRPERSKWVPERRGNSEAVFRFAPGDFAAKRWSEGSASPSGKAYGRGRGFFEYHIKMPGQVVKARPAWFTLQLEAGAKAGREKVDWPSRVNRQDYPQTDARKWPSELEFSVAGKALLRVTLEDDAADARGVLSHLARFEHGSYGQHVWVSGKFTPEMLADLDAGKPLVIRLAVPDDAKHDGGLCVFGAGTGRFPFDPRLVVRTSQNIGPAPSLIDPPVAVDRVLDRRVTLLAPGDSPAPAEWSYTMADPGPGWADAGFDASGWKRGKAGFGTGGTPGVRVATEWDSPRIWLRTTVNLPTLKPGDGLSAHLFHDEDATVFVNGKVLLRARGYVSDYREIPLDDAQRALFRAGPNVVAVSCRQSTGGQGVDLGLSVEPGE